MTKNIDSHFLLVLILAASYFCFWFLYSTYAYQTFNLGYLDLGTAASNFYIHLHYPAAISGLEYLNFMTHISLFQFILMPIFAAFPSPITLIAVQDLLIAMAAVFVYLSANQLIKSKKICIVLVIAFLLNVGTLGLAKFAFHLEAAMLFFFILSFYLYLKSTKYFMLSYVLLLSVFDIAAIIGFILLLSLLLYELKYRGETADRAKRFRMILVSFIVTIIFLIFYVLASHALISSYNSGQYLNAPHITHIIGFISQQASTLGNISNTSILYLMKGAILTMFAFLSFGIYAITNFIMTILLTSPWIVEVFFVHNSNFFFYFTQNQIYATEGVTISSIIGISTIINKKRKSRIESLLANEKVIILIILVLAMDINVPFIMLVIPTNYSAPSINYVQISQILSAKIPRNVSIMSQSGIATHIFYEYNLELPPNESYMWYTPLNQTLYSFYYFKPDYVVYDTNLPDYAGAGNYLETNRANYSLYFSANDLYIYKSDDGHK
jgi:uncharacterized membrane protein